jgi:hypothetical protein
MSATGQRRALEYLQVTSTIILESSYARILEMSQRSQPQPKPQKTPRATAHVPHAADLMKADHRVATSRLRKSKEPFRQAFETMPDLESLPKRSSVPRRRCVKDRSIASLAKTHTGTSNADLEPLFSERHAHNRN